MLNARPELVDGPLGSAAAKSQGSSAAVLIALGCLATGAVYFGGSLLAARLAGPRVERVTASRGGKAAVGVAVAVAVIAAIVIANPGQRFEDFKHDPASDSSGGASIESHLSSSGGSGRWQFWQAAAKEFETEPVRGGGAGSYEAWWAQHPKIDAYYIRDAHSLYLETLAELGVIGLLLVVGAIGSGLVAGVLRLRSRQDRDRSIVAGLIGLFAAYAFAAGIDWMWELTVVSVVAFAALGLLAGPAALVSADTSPRLGTPIRAVVVVVCGFVLLAQSITFLAQTRIRDSQQAVARADSETALTDALAARAIQPWAWSPRLQLALVQEQQGSLAPAGTSIREAIDRDPTNWRLWLVAARIETKAGDPQAARRSLARANKLNPTSTIFAAQ